MKVRPGATRRFITRVETWRGHSGKRVGRPPRQPITRLLSVPRMAKAMSRNGKKIAAHSPVRVGCTGSTCASRRSTDILSLGHAAILAAYDQSTGETPVNLTGKDACATI